MANEKELRWEWPAERSVQQKLLIEVTDVRSSGGLLGLKKSPSLAQGFPDPVTLRGVIKNSQSEQVKLTLPEFELGTVKPGDLLGVGLVEGSICICVSPVPDGNNPDVWLKQWSCVSEQ